MDDRLLTYPELADALGRSEEAARQLAKRRRWRRVISNEDGRARVAVPIEFLEAPRPPVEPRSADRSNPERPEDDHPVADLGPTGDARALISYLEARVSDANSEIKEVRADLKIAQTVIAELTAQAARVEGLEALLASERERIAELREMERQRAEDVRQRAEEARQRSEELKAERDRWAAAAQTAQERIEQLTAKAAEVERPRGWWPFRRAS
jgi:uncharacterized protein YfcZ (UPF0381/DUF406 family)